MDYYDYGEGEYEDEGVEYADYYEDENYSVEHDISDTIQEQTVDPLSFEELYKFCILTTFNDSYKHLIGILIWSLLFMITSRIIRLPGYLVHLSSVMFGGALVWQMFEKRCSLMGGLCAVTYVNLLITHYLLQKLRGPCCFLIGVIYLIFCEMWLVDPVWWHAIRGIQMIILMKMVSIGYDLDTSVLTEVPNPLEISGYILTPGTIIFGPWISYSKYIEVLKPMELDIRILFDMVHKIVASGMFLILSTCLINWVIPEGSNRWIMAYRDALSFRSSHYFVSYLSEVSLGLSGLGILDVSKPLYIEFPRSLVDVVVYWNMPMHQWLKNYVFKPFKKKLGGFCAIVVTYGMSTLFHGLNFQLGAVLLSLGFYTYTEFCLRKKLANILNACIMARSCTSCQHKHKETSTLALTVNFLLGALTVFHLAYLGMMFDSSQEMQQKGYSMVHTLRKWSALNYSSHWVMLTMYSIMSIL